MTSRPAANHHAFRRLNFVAPKKGEWKKYFSLAVLILFLLFCTATAGDNPDAKELELLLSFLKNPKSDIRPIIEIIQEVCIPMKANVERVYHIPYMITGILNEHPRSGMKVMSAKKSLTSGNITKSRGWDTFGLDEKNIGIFRIMISGLSAYFLVA